VTVLVGTWTKEIDKERMQEVLAGRLPFDETTLVDETSHGYGGDDADADADAKPAVLEKRGGGSDTAREHAPL
jgi:aerobic C4-dicarboxylate transport protein